MVCQESRQEVSVWNRKSKRLLSVLLCISLMVIPAISVMPVSNAESADEETAIAALITAWHGLEREVTELWTIPRSEFRRDTTPEIAAAMGATVEEIGPYYIQHSLPTAGDAFYVAPDGTLNFVSWSKYSSIEFWFQGLDETGTNVVSNKSFTFQLNYNNATTIWPYQDTIPAQKYTITPIISQMTAIFNGVEVTSVKLMNSGSAPLLRMGCIFGRYTEKPALPENTDGWGLIDWVNAAEMLDISSCDNTDDFQVALTAAINQLSSEEKIIHKQVKFDKYVQILLKNFPQQKELIDICDLLVLRKQLLEPR
jgi:hypothetical protein